MKRVIATIIVIVQVLTCLAQDYVIDKANVTTEIKFYSPEIVRVTKYQNSDPLAKTDPKFVVTMVPEDVEIKRGEGANVDTISSAAVRVICNKTSGVLSFYRADKGTLIVRENGRPTFQKRTAHTIDQYNVSQTFRLTDGEAIYGFGQVQDGNLNHRGTNYSHMIQNNTSVWMPYMHSVRGYAIYWDLYGPCNFSDDTGGATFSTEAAHAVDYYLLLGSSTDGDEAIRRMRQLSGQATMVPLWTFGYFQSKERYVSAKETLGVLKKYRQLGVPIDCVVQDWQYWGGNDQWNAMEFLNPEFSSDYQDMIDGIHNDGGHLLISIWANFGRNTKQFAHLRDKNQLMKQGDNIMSATWPNNEGVGIYDPYEKSARDYYWDCLNSGLVDKGVDAYWVDSSEPDHYQSGEAWEETNDFVVLHKDGTDDTTLNPLSTQTDHTWRSVRNAFPLMHASGVYEGHRAQHSSMTDRKRVMIMTRSGFPGMQRYGAGTWSGDITASWQTLANQIPAALNYSACGIPSWNSDIGGFFNGNFTAPSAENYKELYARWIQFGTFCTIMRSHGSGTDKAIWKFGDKGDMWFDIINRYINLRYALLPYIYSIDHKVSAEGFTFMRAMGIAYPSDKNTHSLKDQFMFGKDILVAPVVSEGATSRNVYLPKGDSWTDLWTGETFEGGQSISRNVTVAVMPLYVHAGTIMPWGPKVQYSSESNWDNLEIRIYPGADGTFTLYEDEGDNYNYEQGKYTEIPFTWDDENHSLTIGNRTGAFPGMLEKRTFRIVLVDKDKQLGLGLQQSGRFSKIIEYSGTAVTVAIDNENITKDSSLAVKSFALESNQVSLFAGQITTLKAKATYSNGTWEYVTLDCQLESSNPAAVTVSDGVIRAIDNGTALVTVSYIDANGKTWKAKARITVKEPDNIYAWNAYEWYQNRVADRVNQSDITYSSDANTITITKKGNQNIALRYEGNSWLKAGMRYFVVVASDVSTNTNDSQLWYINGTWVNIVNPYKVTTLQDGRIVIAWTIDETKSYIQTGQTIFGLTSTDANGKSTISYVGFESDINAFIKSLNDLYTWIEPSYENEEMKTKTSSGSIYSLLGTKRTQLEDGVNIVSQSDGTAQKIMK